MAWCLSQPPSCVSRAQGCIHYVAARLTHPGGYPDRLGCHFWAQVLGGQSSWTTQCYQPSLWNNMIIERSILISITRLCHSLLFAVFIKHPQVGYLKINLTVINGLGFTTCVRFTLVKREQTTPEALAKVARCLAADRSRQWCTTRRYVLLILGMDA